MNKLHDIAKRFRASAPPVDFWSLRILDERSQSLAVRQNVPQPVINRRSIGGMLTVSHGGGMAYAATSDLSQTGLARAARQAIDWATCTAKLSLVSAEQMPRPATGGSYRTPVFQHWESLSLKDKTVHLHEASRHLKSHDRIVDWHASLSYSEGQTLFLTSDDVVIEQSLSTITPEISATANRGSQTQTRTHGGWTSARQGGLEQLEQLGFPDEAQCVADEALTLLEAPNCPSGNMDLLLTPSQMVLQIHESIGHPLELDRILGDERNYAGTSFVNAAMFGNYRYGSKLLNVTFDPERQEELASYGYDDEGTPAKREHLIREGILLRPLGGGISQIRSGLPGVANSRACDWNRPAIDRMANLNLEPGASDMQTLVESVERGVLMDANRSWSIDDSRNKFQFGCEYGRLIVDGELREVVRNPNYRGISATFWRNLIQVGDQGTFRVHGVSNCGKGEPNQLIRVGHASPACLFRDVAVFGGTD